MAATSVNTTMENHIPLPPPARFATYAAVCVILLLVATLAVGAKFLLTWKARGRFGKDDGCIALGLITLIATGILGGEAYNHGLGKPSTLVEGYESWNEFRWEYIFYTAWFFPLCFSKLAFFNMYLHTFQGKKMRWTLWISMIVFVGFTITFITMVQLVSSGIADSQIQATKALYYHYDFIYLHYSWGCCDILADLWICVLPLFGMKVLKLSKRRKVVLTTKFAVPAVTFVISMIRIYELNLVTSRTPYDHTWDASLAETVPMIWALVQAAAAIIITTLPSFALAISTWYKQYQHTTTVIPDAEASPLAETVESDPSKAESGNRTSGTIASLATSTSEPTSSHLSRLSKAEKILGQRFKRSKTPDEYSEETHRLDAISGITVTRTVNITTAVDPEEGFRMMYRKYCGQA